MGFTTIEIKKLMHLRSAFDIIINGKLDRKEKLYVVL
jgi:hypothetical protein